MEYPTDLFISHELLKEWEGVTVVNVKPGKEKTRINGTDLYTGLKIKFNDTYYIIKRIMLVRHRPAALIEVENMLTNKIDVVIYSDNTAKCEDVPYKMALGGARRSRRQQNKRKRQTRKRYNHKH